MNADRRRRTQILIRWGALLLGVVRSASTDAVAAAMMRGILGDGPLLALARASGRPDADARASLAGPQLVGLVMARYVIALEPMVSMTPDALAAATGPVIERYLFADLWA